jgi:hemerythrin-like domain-containing protein
MNAIELLMEDHQKALRLMEELEAVDEKMGTDPTGTETFNKLHQTLRLHTEIEEEIFYPAMEGFDVAKQIVEVAYDEHDRIDHLLLHLATLAPNETDFQEALAELRNNLEHHIEEEEGILFPSAEELFDEVKLDELGRQMEEMKSDSKIVAAMAGLWEATKEEGDDGYEKRRESRRGIQSSTSGKAHIEERSDHLAFHFWNSGC